jgi:hypothetical protein
MPARGSREILGQKAKRSNKPEGREKTTKTRKDRMDRKDHVLATESKKDENQQ